LTDSHMSFTFFNPLTPKLFVQQPRIIYNHSSNKCQCHALTLNIREVKFLYILDISFLSLRSARLRSLIWSIISLYYQYHDYTLSEFWIFFFLKKLRKAFPSESEYTIFLMLLIRYFKFSNDNKKTKKQKKFYHAFV